MNKIIYYSLSFDKENIREDMIWQLIASIGSIRQYNTTIPIVVFIYNHCPNEIIEQLCSYRVHIEFEDSYQNRIREMVPQAASTLSQYPVLHRWFNFKKISRFNPDQVLYLDCDTLFFRNPEKLFDCYQQFDCYAREEPSSSRSHYGYDPNYLDESRLEEIYKEKNLNYIPPFNLGVVLLNNKVWEKIDHYVPNLITTVWQLGIWMAENPDPINDEEFGEGPGIDELRANFKHLVSTSEQEQSIAYPSANRWIWDQVTFWLTVAAMDSFSYGDFWIEHVLQNGEYKLLLDVMPNWIVCHYYSQNSERFNQWILRFNSQISASSNLHHESGDFVSQFHKL